MWFLYRYTYIQLVTDLGVNSIIRKRNMGCFYLLLLVSLLLDSVNWRCILIHIKWIQNVDDWVPGKILAMLRDRNAAGNILVEEQQIFIVLHTLPKPLDTMTHNKSIIFSFSQLSCHFELEEERWDSELIWMLMCWVKSTCDIYVQMQKTWQNT